MDIHLLAYTYHWGRNELWDMSRSERDLWSKLVQYQKKVEANAIKNGGK